MTRRDALSAFAFATLGMSNFGGRRLSPSNSAGAWEKYSGNPVIGGSLGTVFDVAVLKKNNRYLLWGSWRPRKSIALFESADGKHWSEPRMVLSPTDTGWEHDINRPGVVKRSDGYHLWYTGQANGRSSIGYATSRDGKEWRRMGRSPVLSAELPWEKVAVMCPQVIWDQKLNLFRMWYSGGEQYEPDAIGYATSPDGIHWLRYSGNPMFQADPGIHWESQKVTGAQVLPLGGWFYMFYIGFRDIDHAQIGVARSRDGITGWDRLATNPIIRPAEGSWDSDACYKPSVIYEASSRRWMLWYNVRRKHLEQIGLATHDGENLGFD